MTATRSWNMKLIMTYDGRSAAAGRFSVRFSIREIGDEKFIFL
jgi:hypothetical protein